LIDITAKTATLREATARAVVRMSPQTVERIRQGTVPKGDPLEVARVAATQAVKNTAQIIPYCHPMPIEAVKVTFEIGDNRVTIDLTARAIYKTGVEMEAMTGASIAALTVYDMLKMLDETMGIEGVELLTKTGGKSDFRKIDPTHLQAAVLVMSDTIADGKKEDLSGRLIRERLEGEGLSIADYRIIPDDTQGIADTLIDYADTQKLNLVITTGGTGFSPRDNTPEAMRQVIEREAPGVAEAMRAYGQTRTPFSMLARGVAGIRGRTLIVNLPGSRKGVQDSLNALFPGLLHAFKMLRGEGHADDPRSGSPT
jgi:cyclic pyranopterin monophosphate synthase